jgi:hypothetical protein
MKKLKITTFSRSKRQLAYTARLDDLQFSTSLWYESVDFQQLEARYGAPFMRQIYFHIVAFDANRLISLQPGRVDFGPFADLVTPQFAELWLAIFRGVWGQWRYENNLPDYHRPALTIQRGRAAGPVAVNVAPGQARTLAFCGGGKDSLLAMRLLQEAGEPFDSLAYSHSVYGDHGRQHRLIDGLLDRTAAAARHRIWIYDDFLPAPVLRLCPELGVRSVAAAETPASAFAALPLALAHGFQYLLLAHEKSADSSNMIWAETGEAINHQWGKSLAAERLLATYIAGHLLSNVRYFSLLKPIHDAVIFATLGDYLDGVGATHSCNVEKPWCRRCAKCAYVWLNYAAYLPPAEVERIFGENLFDVEDNLEWFRQLVGLAEHTPFECVGQVEESRLAFELCARQGYQGKALAMFADAFPQASSPESLEPLFAVAGDAHLIPAELAGSVLPILERKATRGRQRTWHALGWQPAGAATALWPAPSPEMSRPL